MSVRIARKQCIHALCGKLNSLGEVLLHCEMTGEDENVTLGNCIGNCEGQEKPATSYTESKTKTIKADYKY